MWEAVIIGLRLTAAKTTTSCTSRDRLRRTATLGSATTVKMSRRSARSAPMWLLIPDLLHLLPATPLTPLT